MAEFGGALDAYLEAPYVNAARYEQAFERWCEENDVPFDAPDAEERFEEWIESLGEEE